MPSRYSRQLHNENISEEKRPWSMKYGRTEVLQAIKFLRMFFSYLKRSITKFQTLFLTHKKGDSRFQQLQLRNAARVLYSFFGFLLTFFWMAMPGENRYNVETVVIPRRHFVFAQGKEKWEAIFHFSIKKTILTSFLCEQKFIYTATEGKEVTF